MCSPTYALIVAMAELLSLVHTSTTERSALTLLLAMLVAVDIMERMRSRLKTQSKLVIWVRRQWLLTRWERRQWQLVRWMRTPSLWGSSCLAAHNKLTVYEYACA